MKRFLKAVRNCAFIVSVCAVLPWMYIFAESKNEPDAIHLHPMVNEGEGGYSVGYKTAEKAQLARC